MIFYTYALGMWFGGRLVANSIEGNGNTTAGDIFSVFYGIMMGTFALGSVGPSMTALAAAKGGASNILSIIRKKSEIDSMDVNGIKPESCEGDVEFKNISFCYPSRPESKILNNYNLKIHPGQTIGLVGGSGGGKSTIIGLLERFYDPLEGEVLLDGKNINSLNIQWLRCQMGLVNQV